MISKSLVKVQSIPTQKPINLNPTTTIEEKIDQYKIITRLLKVNPI